MGPLLARFLRDVAAGKVDRPAFVAPAAGARKNVVCVPDERSIQVLDHRGAVKDLAMVAIAAESEPVEHGTCELESKGTKVSAKRLDISLTVTVTAEGRLMAWLETLAK